MVISFKSKKVKIIVMVLLIMAAFVFNYNKVIAADSGNPDLIGTYVNHGNGIYLREPNPAQLNNATGILNGARGFYCLNKGYNFGNGYKINSQRLYNINSNSNITLTNKGNVTKKSALTDKEVYELSYAFGNGVNQYASRFYAVWKIIGISDSAIQSTFKTDEGKTLYNNSEAYYNYITKGAKVTLNVNDAKVDNLKFGPFTINFQTGINGNYSFKPTFISLKKGNNDVTLLDQNGTNVNIKDVKSGEKYYINISNDEVYKDIDLSLTYKDIYVGWLAACDNSSYNLQAALAGKTYQEEQTITSNHKSKGIEINLHKVDENGLSINNNITFKVTAMQYDKNQGKFVYLNDQIRQKELNDLEYTFNSSELSGNSMLSLTPTIDNNKPENSSYVYIIVEEVSTINGYKKINKPILFKYICSKYGNWNSDNGPTFDNWSLEYLQEKLPENKVAIDYKDERQLWIMTYKAFLAGGYDIGTPLYTTETMANWENNAINNNTIANELSTRLKAIWPQWIFTGEDSSWNVAHPFAEEGKPTAYRLEKDSNITYAVSMDCYIYNYPDIPELKIDIEKYNYNESKINNVTFNVMAQQGDNIKTANITGNSDGFSFTPNSTDDVFVIITEGEHPDEYLPIEPLFLIYNCDLENHKWNLTVADVNEWAEKYEIKLKGNNTLLQQDIDYYSYLKDNVDGFKTQCDKEYGNCIGNTGWAEKLDYAYYKFKISESFENWIKDLATYIDKEITANKTPDLKTYLSDKYGILGTAYSTMETSEKLSTTDYATIVEVLQYYTGDFRETFNIYFASEYMKNRLTETQLQKFANAVDRQYKEFLENNIENWETWISTDKITYYSSNNNKVVIEGNIVKAYDKLVDRRIQTISLTKIKEGTNTKLSGALFSGSISNIKSYVYNKTTNNVPEGTDYSFQNLDLGTLQLNDVMLKDASEDVVITLNETEAPGNYKALEGEIRIELHYNSTGGLTLKSFTYNGEEKVQVNGIDKGITEPVQLNNYEVNIVIPNLKIINLSGYVWLDDQDGIKPAKPYDGVMGAGEQKLEGIAVKLYKMNETGKNPIKTTQTDETGKYLFENIPVGSYYIEFSYDGINYEDTYTVDELRTFMQDKNMKENEIDQALNNMTISRAHENGQQRAEFNDRFRTIYYDKSIEGTQMGYYYSEGKSKLDTEGHFDDFKMTATIDLEQMTESKSNLNLGLVKREFDLALSTNLEEITEEQGQKYVKYKVSVKNQSLKEAAEVNVNYIYDNNLELDENRSLSSNKADVQYDNSTIRVNNLKEGETINCYLVFKVNTKSDTSFTAEITSYSNEEGLVDKDSRPGNYIDHNQSEDDNDMVEIKSTDFNK